MATMAQSMPTVLVTGVSSGIGLAIAEDLLQGGYQVFGSVRRTNDAEDLAARWPQAFVPLIFDVTNMAALPEVVAQVRAALGGRGLKALVNNAGINSSGPLMHQPLAEVREVFEVNVFGLLAMTQAFLPLLGASRDAGFPPGRVVNIGSVSGGMTAPFMGAYSASKHALEAISQALRRELALYGIEVSTLEPSFIKSRIYEKAKAAKPSEKYQDTDFAAAWTTFSESLLRQEARAKPTTIVTRAVRHAIEAPRPRPRYPLDASWYLGRYLPDRWFDKIIYTAMGIGKLLKPKS